MQTLITASMQRACFFGRASEAPTRQIRKNGPIAFPLELQKPDPDLLERRLERAPGAGRAHQDQLRLRIHTGAVEKQLSDGRIDTLTIQRRLDLEKGRDRLPLVDVEIPERIFSRGISPRLKQLPQFLDNEAVVADRIHSAVDAVTPGASELISKGLNLNTTGSKREHFMLSLFCA